MYRLLGIRILSILNVEPVDKFELRHEDDQDGFEIYLKKSQSSAAESISACHAFFPCPSIVAAIISYRYFPLIKSAALRKTAALSAKGKDSQAGFAARAASMALDTSSLLAFE